MFVEGTLIEKLRKLEALHAGTRVDGEPDVLEAFVLELSRSLKRRAKQSLGLETVEQALTGAVSVIQRGDSSLRLNVHYHVISLDGAYVRDKPDGPLVFHTLPAPTADEVTDVAGRTALRVQKVIERHGRSLDGNGDRDGDDAQPAEQLALSACYGAAASGLGLEGERAGQPLLRIVAPGLARDAEPVAQIMGFNVRFGLAQSLILIDMPELFQHAADHEAFYRGLLAIAPSAQFIVATGSSSLVQCVGHDQTIALVL